MKGVSIHRLLALNIAMAVEKNGDRLLERILTEAMSITQCDGGTIYILENDALEFKVMVTKSLDILKGGVHGKIDLPPVALNHSHVCAYSVLENRLVNIPDVRRSELFDFSGPIRYDSLTGYVTKSMMVVPMENDRGEIIGVMQLINAKDEDDVTIAFIPESEIILLALASQAAVSLTNMNYTRKMQDLMESIVETFSTVIYHRTPYNVHHTTNMVKYANAFMDYLDEINSSIKFDERHRRQFLMSIWLHDVGKLVIPLEVMNKGTRLEEKLEEIMTRFDIIALLGKVEALEQQKDCTKFLEELNYAREQVIVINSMGYVEDSRLEEIIALGRRKYTNQHGEECTWLTEDEIDALCIRKGTLTATERQVMESHVRVTRDILEKIRFDGDYKNVPKWAGAHHEFLDGTGYPDCKSGETLDMETRLLTILDIFEGITALDRPYKSGVSPEKALIILAEMVEEGKLDRELFRLFADSRAWEKALYI